MMPVSAGEILEWGQKRGFQEVFMGGGEAGAGRCERCGQVGPIRKVGGMMYLCSRCRQVYEQESMRKHAEAQKKKDDSKGGQTQK
ncbi:MAG TPA: hypothetical protein PK876_04795 [Elusimicrobiota bacterium]|nr:hypothetical protein [Elusimicrobiota bacterium]